MPVSGRLRLEPLAGRRFGLVSLGVVAAAIAVVYWPGHMSGDTLAQIEQARSGEFSDYHAPVLVSLWSVVWDIVPGTWYVLLATTTLFVGSLYVLLRGMVPHRRATFASIAIACSPMILGYLGVISRDTWFIALTLAAFAAVAAAYGATGRRQRLLLVVSWVAAALAMAARQNGFPICAVIVWVGLPLVSRPALSASWLRRALATIGVLAAIGGGQLAYQRVVLDVDAAHPEQAIFIYDAVGMSLRTGEVLLPDGVFPSQDLDALRTRVSTSSIDGALFSRPVLIPFPVRAEYIGDLRESWFDAVLEHPAAYLDTRWDLWLEQVGWSGDPLWVHHPFVDPNPWGYRPTFPALEERANDYVTWFAGSPALEGGLVHKVWVYLMVDCLALLYLRNKDPRRRILGALAVAVILYEGTIFIGAMGNQYRFSLLAVTTALVVAVVGASDVASWARRRRRGPEVVVEPEATPVAVEERIEVRSNL